MIEEYLKGLPLYENDAKLTGKFAFLIEGWRRSFPDVDIKSEIAWSHAWLLVHPKKKNNARFITNWLGSAQRRISQGRPVRPPSVPPPKYDVKDEDIMTGDDWKRMREAI